MLLFNRQQLVTSTARMQMEQAQRIASAVDRALESVKQRERELQEQDRQAAVQKKQQADREAAKKSAGKKVRDSHLHAAVCGHAKRRETICMCA